MGKIITGIEFAILAAIIIGIIILLNVMEARRRINAKKSNLPDDNLALEEARIAKDFQEAMAQYNDTEPEQPFFPTPSAKEEFLAKAEADRQARSREAVKRAQAAAYHAQRMHVQELEKEYRAEQEQHNSSFRALGMTPVPTYPDQDAKIVFDPAAQKHIFVRHFAEDLSKRDDEMAKVINGIRRRVLDEQRAALDRITGQKS